MASPSTKPKGTPARKRKQDGGPMQFVGPAQKSFESFMELAMFTLDTNFPMWNDPQKPISYILPPTFPFMHPEKSDQDIDLEKEAAGSFVRTHIDRQSNQGEFVVFHALWALSQENLDNSFLAIRGLNLDRLMVHLKQIFPSATSDLCDKFKGMMREYDFVLIGPTIGVIVIEVKSSTFTKERDFASKSTRLPDQLVHSITQLKSFNLAFFHECAGSQLPPAVQLRRILFTPNLAKARYQDWFNNLEEAAKGKIDEKLSGITHWFMDEDSSKPALSSSLRQFIQADGFQIPIDIFELYGPIIVGLQSAQIFHNEQSTELTSQSLSTSAAILRDALALDTQDPRKLLLSNETQTKRVKTDIDQEAVVNLSSKIVLLTPEQQKVLNGPNRQFIFGPPGTGKTILLQAKALEILKNDKSVLVVSNSNFMEHYRKLFDDHGFKNYKIRSIVDIKCDIMDRMEALVDICSDSPEKAIEKLNYLPTSEMLDFLGYNKECDAIFIDDAVDDARTEEDEAAKTFYLLCSLLIAMTMGEVFYDSKLIWIALDPFFPTQNDNIHGRLYQYILTAMIGRGSQSISRLHRVMRCSESVYRATYCPEILAQMAVKPAIGHKIHGFADSVPLYFVEESESIRTKPFTINQLFIKWMYWKHIHRALDTFRQEGFHNGQMAVIIGNLGSDNVEDGVSFCQFISNKCEECGIPTVDTQHMLSGDGKLVVGHWHNVSSLEWPVVIFVTGMNHRNSLMGRGYDRYRACSRATMRLFQIIAHYNLPKRRREADICKEANGHYMMAPNERRKSNLLMSNMAETPDQLVEYEVTSDYETEKAFDVYLEARVTLRRSFSVHNLDLSKISNHSDSFKLRKMRLDQDLAFGSMVESTDSERENAGKELQNVIDSMNDISLEKLKSIFNSVTTSTSNQQPEESRNQRSMLRALYKKRITGGAGFFSSTLSLVIDIFERMTMDEANIEGMNHQQLEELNSIIDILNSEMDVLISSVMDGFQVDGIQMMEPYENNGREEALDK